MDFTIIIGLIAGAGTTFAALPDLITMVRRRSSRGMNPRMAAITGSFQVLWVIYGALIGSTSVELLNIIAELVNSFTFAAFVFFRRAEQHRASLEPA
jgi:MtN3 and saliva related transmembrane protein